MTTIFANLQNAWFNMKNREEGQTMAEYALVLGLLVAVTALIFTTLGGSILEKLNFVNDAINGGAAEGGE